MLDKWDKFFLGMAHYVSTASKDKTKCGCVIVDKDRRVVSMGFNGFARGVSDAPELYADRPTKLRRVIHAEENAVIFARRDLADCVCFTWPCSSCSHCQAVVIQAGIRRCVAPVDIVELGDRWREDSIDAFAQRIQSHVTLNLAGKDSE